VPNGSSRERAGGEVWVDQEKEVCDEAIAPWLDHDRRIRRRIRVIDGDMGLMTVSPAPADNGCGIGWYYNTDVRWCQPYTGGPKVTGCFTTTGRRGRVTAGVCVGN